MNKDLLNIGIIMQFCNLLALGIFFVSWSFYIILLSMYVLFNIASLIFIFVGLFGGRE